MKKLGTSLVVIAALAISQGQTARSSRTIPGVTLSAGHGMPVSLGKPLKLSKVNVGSTFTVSLIDQGIPFVSSIDQGNRLPKGWKLQATVLDTSGVVGSKKDPKKIAFVFDKLIRPDGSTAPFLGGMAASDPGGLPTWVFDKKAERDGHAASMEGLATAVSWCAELGPIGILAGTLGTKLYQKVKTRKAQVLEAKQMALTILDSDLPSSKFYVVPTIDIRVKL